ncbi:MAG: hypothetical protein DRP85_00020 [Candidatus Makaraimicrobium thalassicum]|nr:MAG: hypothetical protein DRP85_00020 [Candidatus Omnitrophota bacterium]
MRGIKKSVFIFFIVLLTLSLNPAYCDTALKDLKNIYLEYDLQTNEQSFKMKDKEKEEHGQKFAAKLKEIGFNLVDDKSKADAVVHCYLYNVKNAIFYWVVENIRVDFALPNKDFIIASFKRRRAVGGSINDLENAVIKKIQADYVSGEPKFTIDSKGMPVKIEKKRYVYTVLDKKIIYEGEENITKDLWLNPKKSTNQLEILGNKESPKSVAILVYHTHMSPFATITWFGNVIDDRADDTLKYLKNKGILLTSPSGKTTIADTYGYLIRYDIKDKKYGINYFSSITDGGKMNLKRYTADVDETNQGDQLYRRNRQYYRDISYLLSERITDYFVDKNFRVMNLTPARAEFNNMTPQKILDKVKTLYGIDTILLMPYTAYTRWIFDKNPERIKTYIGFQLGYAAYMFQEGNDEPLFKFGEDIKPVWSEASYIVSSKINFFSAEKDDEGELSVLKDGIIDDVWIVGKTLKKFSGYEKGLTQKVRIGGELFTKLSENGY